MGLGWGGGERRGGGVDEAAVAFDGLISGDEMCVDGVDDGEDIDFGSMGAGGEVGERAGAEEGPDVSGGFHHPGSVGRCCTRESECGRAVADMGRGVEFGDCRRD